MALTSYFDLAVSAPQLQQAAASTFAKQRADRLAVLPRLNLSTAMQQALAQCKAGQRLAGQQQQNDQDWAIDQRRLVLDTERQEFDASQLPWATAAGALGAAVQLYGGYCALQDADAMQQMAERNEAIRQETHAQERQRTAEAVKQTGLIRQVYKRPCVRSDKGGFKRCCNKQAHTPAPRGPALQPRPAATASPGAA